MRVAALFVAAVLVLAVSVAPAAAAMNPPNIIFILSDDVGYGDLGCYGQENFTTPRLDRMAAEGMRFTQHYTGSTVCAPSRACLLTGQHTGHVYQRANGPHQFRANPQDLTIATRLQGAGYHTAMIGKSGLSCETSEPGLPNAKGFHHFFGYLGHRDAHRYYPTHLWQNGQRVDYAGNQGKEGVTYSGEVFLADTLRYLDERAEAGGPFFLHLSLQQSHADLQAPDKWRRKFIGKYEEPPFREQKFYRSEAHPKATYAAMMAYLDHTVGKVLDKLAERGLAENTLVLFASDNGAMSEGGWSRQYFNSSGPLTGGKRDLYEGGIRTPLIAWWPGKVQPGGVTDHVSAFWDFAPTACEIAGASPIDNTDGVSYLPTLLGKPGEQKTHNYLYWEFYEQGGKQAVRVVGPPGGPQWKGVRLGVRKDRDAPIELYDLANDLAEQNNVAVDHPEVVAKVEAMMDEAHTPSPVVSFSKR
ncbi:MAG: arylsulfatase [Planctomycetota bacterium]